MAYSLRLPPGLDADARAYCARVGCSLNGLVGMALDRFLREPVNAGAVRQELRDLGVREGVPQLGVARGRDIDGAFDLEMQRIEDAKPKKQVSTDPPERLLERSRAGEKLPKADRVALTDWVRAQKAAGKPVPGWRS